MSIQKNSYSTRPIIQFLSEFLIYLQTGMMIFTLDNAYIIWKKNTSATVSARKNGNVYMIDSVTSHRL